jgi:DNA-binding MarR family transcriptional regulator
VTARSLEAMEPRWLSDNEQEVWRAYLSMVSAVRKSMSRQLMTDADMPPAYFEILVHLSEAGDRTLRMSELAHATDGTQSQLSHAVNRLEERGWVRRQRCEADGRGLYAVLTDEGMAALEAAAPGHVQCVRQMFFDRLTPQEQRQLLSISQSVAAGCSQIPSHSAAD